MNSKMLTLRSPDFPHVLRDIPSRPKQLYWQGVAPGDLMRLPRVAIVGNRKISAYGQQSTRELASKLAEQGIVIISGLAMGVDEMALISALEADGRCIAVLPGPLDNIVPVSNRRLAQQILDNDGALISEYAPGEVVQRQNFIARNRLMSGLADAVLITEAGEKSGSLYTARFAIDQGREVMAVPGSIYGPQSVGANTLIKTGHASAVTSLNDVLNILNLHPHVTVARQVKGRNAHEQAILDLMLQGVSEGDQLLMQSSLTTIEFNRALTMLEIGSKIRPLGGNNWAIA